jgi:hypothetical protein
VAATSAILRAFAELVPTGQRSGLDVTSGRHPLVWLGLRTGLVHYRGGPTDTGGNGPPGQNTGQVWHRHDGDSQRLAALDALHQHERLLREGWVYLVGSASVDGSATVDGERRRVCHPLLA